MKVAVVIFKNGGLAQWVEHLFGGSNPLPATIKQMTMRSGLIPTKIHNDILMHQSTFPRSSSCNRTCTGGEQVYDLKLLQLNAEGYIKT